MRKIAVAFLAAALLAASAPAPAGAQSLAPLVSELPAATLLLPYFEVDLARSRGANTVFSVSNASASPALAHVTVWSDLAVPVFGFDLYLTGFDVQVVDLRRVLSRALPRTADLDRDPSDAISPRGEWSLDATFPDCAGRLPPAAPSLAESAAVRAALTGRPSALFGGLCAGVRHSGRTARGFVTIDATNRCTSLNPADAGYFVSGGAGVASNGNVLWGQYLYSRPSPGGPRRAGATLVPIRADAADPETSAAGQYTFYGRLHGWSGADNRQPLGSTFAARFQRRGSLRSPTDLVIWRDPKVPQGSFPCGSYPSWFRLGMEEFVAFDETEDATLLDGSSAFGAAAQRVRAVAPAVPAPYRSGWLHLDFDGFVAPNAPGEDQEAGQAWVYVIQDAAGRFSGGRAAIMLESAAATSHVTAFPP